jgi:hypothetical protein
MQFITEFWVMLAIFVAVLAWFIYKKFFAMTAQVDNWVKEMVKALLMALCPILYGLLLDKFPTFPLTGEMFTNFFTWFIFIVFFGGSAYFVKKSIKIAAFAQKDLIKDIVKAVLTAVLPILYSLITGKYPDFPVPGEMFVSFIVWIVYAVLWGTSVFHFARAGINSYQLKASKY